MNFKDTISKFKLIQSVFPGNEINIICPISIIKDSDIVSLKSQIRESGIKGGRILRVNDVKLNEQKEEHERDLEAFLNKLTL